MCASHSPTHDAASPRLLRHRKTQIRPYLQCVCGLARTANPGRSRMEIRPDAIAPLHNTGEGEVQSLKSAGRRPKSNLCGLQQCVTWRSCYVCGKRWRCWWPAAPGPEPPSAK